MIAVAAGVASGLVFIAPASDSTVGLILVNFTHLPLFLVGLSFGISAAAIASVSATALVGLVIDISSTIPYLAAFALPVLVIVRQSLLSRTSGNGTVEWYPTGHLLSILAVYGAAVFIVVTVVKAGDTQDLRKSVEAMFEAGLTLFAPDLPDARRSSLAGQAAAIFPAMIVASWLMTITLNAALSQSILARSGRNLRPTPIYSCIEVPAVLALGVAGGGILWLTTSGTLGYTAKMLTIILALPYFFQGLAVVHRVTPYTWVLRFPVLVVFYFLMLFILGWLGLLLIAGLGFVEQWVGLRRRIAGVPSGEEEE